MSGADAIPPAVLLTLDKLMSGQQDVLLLVDCKEIKHLPKAISIQLDIPSLRHIKLPPAITSRKRFEFLCMHA